MKIPILLPSVEQKLFDGQIDWTAVMADAAWGFIDGAISSSPLGAWWKVASDATISLGKELTDVYIASMNISNTTIPGRDDIIYGLCNLTFNRRYEYVRK